MAAPVDLIPRMRRWTRVEYERLVELGVFRRAERLELLDGALVVREPQGSRHAAGIRRVLDALRPTLGDAWQIGSLLPIALDDSSEPEPDVSVVRRDPGAYRDAHPSGPVLLVEVADASYRIDRQHKSTLYARAGVPEYWVVDVADNAVIVHRDPGPAPRTPGGFRYGSVSTLRPPAGVVPLVAPGRAIPIADLLP
jgi:Uma2 family endonuclease